MVIKGDARSLDCSSCSVQGLRLAGRQYLLLLKAGSGGSEDRYCYRGLLGSMEIFTGRSKV